MTKVAQEELSKLDASITECNIIYLPQVHVVYLFSTIDEFLTKAKQLRVFHRNQHLPDKVVKSIPTIAIIHFLGMVCLCYVVVCFSLAICWQSLEVNK